MFDINSSELFSLLEKRLISDKDRRVLGGIIETKQKVYPEFAAI